MDKLNVLWIIPHLDRRLVELASNLGALGIGVHIAAQQGSPYQLPGIDSSRVPLRTGLRSIRSLRFRARNLLKSSGAGLVHAAGLPAIRIATHLGGGRTGLRLVAEYDGGPIPAWCRLPFAGFDHPRIAQVLLREPYHQAYFERRTGIAANRIRVIPFGIRPDWFRQPGMQCWAREDNSRMFILGVSLEHISSNNLKLVLAACNLLPPEANIKLLLIDRTDRCDRVVRELHRWPENVVARTHVVIDKFDPGTFWSVCTSSLHFPTPHSKLNELRDSMVSAVTPIVVTGDGTQIIEDMATGLVVSSPNPHSLCQAIQFLRDDLAACRAMALKARETVLSACSIEGSATALAAIYRRVVGDKSRSPATPLTRNDPGANKLEHASL